MTDARERRRQRAEENKEGTDVKSIAKKYRVPAIIVLVWGAIVAFQVAQGMGIVAAGQECPGHWHPVMDVVVDGEHLDFNRAKFIEHGEGRAAGFHVHDGTGVLHFHPATERCIPLEDAMEHLELEATSTHLTLGPTYGAMAGTYEVNETHQLHVFYQKWGEDTWRERSISSVTGRQPGNGDRILLTYGELDETLIQAQQAAVPVVPANYEPPETEDEGLPDENKVGIMAASGFAIVALLVWRSLSKGAA